MSAEAHLVHPWLRHRRQRCLQTPCSLLFFILVKSLNATNFGPLFSKSEGLWCLHMGRAGTPPSTPGTHLWRLLPDPSSCTKAHSAPTNHCSTPAPASLTDATSHPPLLRPSVNCRKCAGVKGTKPQPRNLMAHRKQGNIFMLSELFPLLQLWLLPSFAQGALPAAREAEQNPSLSISQLAQKEGAVHEEMPQQAGKG